MTPERWQQVETIFHAALKRDSASRAVFLDGACLSDGDLRAEVEAMLAAHEQAGSFMQTPAADLAGEMMVSEQAHALAGRSLGPYQIVSRIGAGGMGEVWLAQDARLKRSIALKLLPEYFTHDQARLQRFKQEARAASALNHPNIITIFEIGQIDSTHFIATEYIEGQTLRQVVITRGLPMLETIEVAVQVASALQAAHQAGIVHRDIKPENIMLRPDGYVKVLDFGLAKLTEKRTLPVEPEASTFAGVSTDPGMVMGTVSYMSPEQARGREVDARTDIFSLGVVLYELLAGRAPFEGETTTDIIAAILDKQPPPLARYAPDVPAELQRIVSKALRKNADERYQLSKELLNDLREMKQELEAHARLGDQRAVAGGAFSTEPRAAVKTDETATQATSSAAVILGEFKKHKTGAVLVFALLALVLAAGIYAWKTNDKSEATAAGIKSMLVLPFKPLAAAERDETLEFGMADALITKLSKLRALIVRPTSAMLKYNDARQDSLAAGREQQVEAVLEGKVQRAGGRIRVTVQLLRTSDGCLLWADTFDRQDDNLFAMQDSISQQVASALLARLTAEEQRQLAKRYTDNSAAYQLYQQGRFFWNKFNEEGLKKSVEYFNQALTLDAHYALAFVGLAAAHGVQGNMGVVPPTESGPKSKRAAEKAVELDDTLAEAHSVLGAIRMFFDWDWPGAEKELKRALELNPNDPEPHNLYGYYLEATGQIDKAISELRRAQELAPLSALVNKDLAEALFFQGKNEEALSAYRSASEIDPNFLGSLYWPTVIYAHQRDYAQAIAAGQKAIAVFGRKPAILAALGYGYAVAGQPQEAHKLLSELETKWKERYFPPMRIAVVYAGLGDKDGAMAWLTKAYEARDAQLIFLNAEPEFASLHADARYRDLLRRMGLAQ